MVWYRGKADYRKETAMKILVTSGGTVIKIDSVRKICNMSKGTFGSKIANEFLISTEFNIPPNDWDNRITFLHAKGSKMPMESHSPRVKFVEYVTFDDYAAELEVCLKDQPDIIVLAAAVSDYGVENPVNGKIRSGDDLVIRLKPLPKLISTVRNQCPNAVLCGFKLLVNSTEDELKEAIYQSILKNRCDIVVGNDLRDIKNDNHQLLIGESYTKSSDPNYFGVTYDLYGKGFDLAKVVVDRCFAKLKEKQ